MARRSETAGDVVVTRRRPRPPVDADDERRSEPIESRILRAARDCIFRLGVDKTSMIDVADAASVSRGSVYKYFPTKARLVRAVQDAALDEGLMRVQQVLQRETTLAAQLRAVVKLTLEMERETNRTGVPLDPFFSVPLFVVESPGALQRGVDTFVPTFVRAIEHGEARSDLKVREAAEWFVRMLTSINMYSSVAVGTRNPEKLAGFVVDQFLHGVAPAFDGG